MGKQPMQVLGSLEIFRQVMYVVFFICNVNITRVPLDSDRTNSL